MHCDVLYTLIFQTLCLGLATPRHHQTTVETSPVVPQDRFLSLAS